MGNYANRTYRIDVKTARLCIVCTRYKRYKSAPRDTEVIRPVRILRRPNQPPRRKRMSSMQASETSPIRTTALPTAPLAMVR